MVACILILVKLLTTPLLVSTYLFRISEEVQLFSGKLQLYLEHSSAKQCIWLFSCKTEYQLCSKQLDVWLT